MTSELSTAESGRHNIEIRLSYTDERDLRSMLHDIAARIEGASCGGTDGTGRGGRYWFLVDGWHGDPMRGSLDKLEQLLQRCKCGVHLEINSHRDVYVTIEDAITDLELCGHEIEPNTRRRMIEADTLVDLHFYPDTPVGFHKVLHCDLSTALDRALNQLGGQKALDPLAAIEAFQLDLQFLGQNEQPERRWRAYQGIRNEATEIDLREGYGETPAAAVAACVSAIESAAEAEHHGH